MRKRRGGGRGGEEEEEEEEEGEVKTTEVSTLSDLQDLRFSLRILVFSHAMLCRCVRNSRHFEGSFETSETMDPTTQHHMRENRNPYLTCLYIPLWLHVPGT
jgi:hypothetical protein